MQPSSSTSPARVVVPGSERLPFPDATRIANVDPSERALVTVIVRPRQPLEPALQSMTVNEPSARTYLDRSEFAARYGAAVADVEAVERFALEHGLLVMEADLARRSVVLGACRA